MTEGNTELHRLDQMGRHAANKARHENKWRNHSRDRDHTERHAALGPGVIPKTPIVGRLAVTVGMFTVICIVLSIGFGIATPGAYALVAVMLIEIGLFVLKRRRLARLQAQGAGLQAQLHDLKQQDFELRYQQAKANGDLDRFNKGADS